MAKNKTVYVCQECGHESLKWLGKCPACSAWNSMVEEVVQTETAARRGLSLGLSSGQNPVPIGEVNVEETPRFSTGSGELNRVLGGGLLPGSLTMIVEILALESRV